tara:strand:+ start:463 stop:1203 length:741 start_codon:yes stop_codon:yes gene_type:complete
MENDTQTGSVVADAIQKSATASGSRSRTRGLMAQEESLIKQDYEQDISEIESYLMQMGDTIREERSPMSSSSLAPEESLKPEGLDDVVYKQTALEKNDVDYATIAKGIREAAEELKMDPQELATIVSFETAGSFSPTKKGPTTKWGQHKGLIQFGEPQAKQHGVNWSDPYGSQLGADGAIVDYFKAKGYKEGMSLLDAYSIVNAGAAGLYNRSDAGAGGTAGTVRDKVEKQMSGHKAKARRLLENY